MQSSKIRLGVLFGGRSTEHEISIRSAANIVRAVDPARYDLVYFGLDRQGGWHLAHADALKGTEIRAEGSGSQYAASTLAGVLPELSRCDCIIPVLHGTFGEDGTVQGLLRLLDLPFVGADVLGSAVGMDKLTMKRLLKESAIPIGRYAAFRDSAAANQAFAALSKEWGLPLFVKPSAQGSSVGVSRAANEAEYRSAVAHAFEFDDVILVEEAIAGREIECAILGNDEPVASVCGEIIPKGGFYSYENKYLNEDGAAFEKPAKLSDSVMKSIQDLSVRVYQSLECAGLARVDVFLKADGSVLVNEINTLPGFTSISMYPQLFELSGVKTHDLIDRLVHLARDRWRRRSLKKVDR
jgi:D-alanine-D-alanine ligase